MWCLCGFQFFTIIINKSKQFHFFYYVMPLQKLDKYHNASEKL